MLSDIQGTPEGYSEFLMGGVTAVEKLEQGGPAPAQRKHPRLQALSMRDLRSGMKRSKDGSWRLSTHKTQGHPRFSKDLAYRLDPE